jgi:hypothetical protein
LSWPPLSILIGRLPLLCMALGLERDCQYGNVYRQVRAGGAWLLNGVAGLPARC